MKALYVAVLCLEFFGTHTGSLEPGRVLTLTYERYLVPTGGELCQ
jgi:hypothetical protein